MVHEEALTYSNPPPGVTLIQVEVCRKIKRKL